MCFTTGIACRTTVVTTVVACRTSGAIELGLRIHVATFANGAAVAERELVARCAIGAIRARSTIVTGGTVVANGTGSTVITCGACVTGRTSRSASAARCIGATEAALLLRGRVARYEVLSAAFRGRGVTGHQNAFWLVQNPWRHTAVPYEIDQTVTGFDSRVGTIANRMLSTRLGTYTNHTKCGKLPACPEPTLPW